MTASRWLKKYILSVNCERESEKMAKITQVWGGDVKGQKLNHIYALYVLFIDARSGTWILKLPMQP